MIEIPRNPRKRDLAVFGALMGPFFALFGWMLLRHLGSPVPAWIVWCGGGALTLAFLCLPAARTRIYVGWMIAVYPIGWVISHLIVLVIYYLVVVPVGLVLKLTGRDPMRRGPRYRAESYWRERTPVEDRRRYFRQF